MNHRRSITLTAMACLLVGLGIAFWGGKGDPPPVAEVVERRVPLSAIPKRSSGEGAGVSLMNPGTAPSLVSLLTKIADVPAADVRYVRMPPLESPADWIRKDEPFALDLTSKRPMRWSYRERAIPTATRTFYVDDPSGRTVEYRYFSPSEPNSD